MQRKKWIDSKQESDQNVNTTNFNTCNIVMSLQNICMTKTRKMMLIGVDSQGYSCAVQINNFNGKLLFRFTMRTLTDCRVGATTKLRTQPVVFKK